MSVGKYRIVNSVSILHTSKPRQLEPDYGSFVNQLID